MAKTELWPVDLVKEWRNISFGRQHDTTYGKLADQLEAAIEVQAKYWESVEREVDMQRLHPMDYSAVETFVKCAKLLRQGHGGSDD